MESCTDKYVIVAYWKSTYDGSKPALSGEIEITPECSYTGLQKEDILISCDVPGTEFVIFALNPLKIYTRVNLPLPHIPLGAKLYLKDKIGE